MTFRARIASLQTFPAVIFAAFMLLVAAASVAPAYAQLGTDLDLRQEDIDMAKAAAAKLLTNPDMPPGTVENWSNATTGNSGTVTLVAHLSPNGMTCRRLQFVINTKGKADPYTFLVDRCLVNGEWKTYP